MKKIGILFVGFVLAGTAVFAQELPALEAGKGDLAVEDLCKGTSGELDQKTFYPGGSLNVKAHCKDGKFEGVLKKYYPNAKIQMKAEYSQGLLNGTVKIHDQKGTIIYRDEYKDGARTAHMRYDEKGELVPVK